MSDLELTNAAKRLPGIHGELRTLYAAHGDDAHARDDYRRLEREWSAALDLLASTRATSPEGMTAKASALIYPPIEDDPNRHSKIATSLARDVLEHFSAWWRVGAENTGRPI